MTKRSDRYKARKRLFRDEIDPLMCSARRRTDPHQTLETTKKLRTLLKENENNQELWLTGPFGVKTWQQAYKGLEQQIFELESKARSEIDRSQQEQTHTIKLKQLEIIGNAKDVTQMEAALAVDNNDVSLLKLKMLKMIGRVDDATNDEIKGKKIDAISSIDSHPASTGIPSSDAKKSTAPPNNTIPDDDIENKEEGEVKEYRRQQQQHQQQHQHDEHLVLSTKNRNDMVLKSAHTPKVKSPVPMACTSREAAYRHSLPPSPPPPVNPRRPSIWDIFPLKDDNVIEIDMYNDWELAAKGTKYVQELFEDHAYIVPSDGLGNCIGKVKRKYGSSRLTDQMDYIAEKWNGLVHKKGRWFLRDPVTFWRVLQDILYELVPNRRIRNPNRFKEDNKELRGEIAKLREKVARLESARWSDVGDLDGGGRYNDSHVNMNGGGDVTKRHYGGGGSSINMNGSGGGGTKRHYGGGGGGSKRSHFDINGDGDEHRSKRTRYD